MWYPALVTVPPAGEPITLAQAKAQCGIEAAETYFDDLLTGYTKAARAYCEAYCGVRLAEQTIVVKCDGFADMARLPVAPVATVSSIAYVDTAGETQTLSTDVYELRADGLEASIVRKYGQAWPFVQPGSRITLTAVVGGVPADDISHAMLLLIAHWFSVREAVNVGNIVTEVPMGVAALLCNHRRGA